MKTYNPDLQDRKTKQWLVAEASGLEARVAALEAAAPTYTIFDSGQADGTGGMPITINSVEALSTRLIFLNAREDLSGSVAGKHDLRVTTVTDNTSFVVDDNSNGSQCWVDWMIVG